jgi:hypothetical protein
VYVAWSLWGQKGKSRVAHFSNLISESVGKLSDLVITGLLGSAAASSSNPVVSRS